MNKKIILASAFTVAVVIGILIGYALNSGSNGVTRITTGGEREVLYWVAPMDPSFRRDVPGTSPMGMELAPVYADQVGGETGVVSIDPTIVNNLGVRTEVAKQGALSRRIETVGYVGYDEDTLRHVHTRVDGWIERLATKSSGESVRKGQLLFELYSPMLVNAQQEYLAAIRSGNTALIDASKDRLAALGVTDSEIARLDKERTVNQKVRFYAEADGVITHLGVREGIFVTPATELMSVAVLNRVWVIAEVFERQSAWVKPGQDVVVELDYLPGEARKGVVDYVYPELDPVTRALKVRLRFENETEVLRPNMFARVTIQGGSTGQVIHVPREALIRGGSSDRLVIALGEGRFRSQPVEVGVESGDRVAILEGISAGDNIVVSGQFLIDSESNIDTAFSRMSNPE